ncbi:NADP-dependent oxidoreductases 1 [Elasticomyces elasticus]|nr:NADP-dependent oxidoreductases 1 [Elasticomyces elasticus]
MDGVTNGANGTNGANSASAVPKTTYLVTGANRGSTKDLARHLIQSLGIGKGLVAAFLLRPNSLVIACVRNPEDKTSKALGELPKGKNSSLITQKLDCSSETDPGSAIAALQSSHQITKLDVVVANAGIAKYYGPTSTLGLDHLKEHMTVNTYSVLLLFQACKALLEKSTGEPKFVFIGAPISTITDMESVARAPLGAYGVSKLAANYLVRKFHFENNWLISFIIDPGHVQTDMGDQGAKLMGRPEAPVTMERCIKGVTARIDEATKEKTSGHFVLHEDGSKVAW